mmetsp:Transcript_60907/g.176138  ORF Transcript_60907/g.176138 Transcript_60907/m.176138 type:complete len:84 (+) Transcript_60907:1224-1475(+)
MNEQARRAANFDITDAEDCERAADDGDDSAQGAASAEANAAVDGDDGEQSPGREAADGAVGAVDADAKVGALQTFGGTEAVPE